MALQLRLGLLSDWGAGITFDHRSRSGDAGALLTSPLGLMEQFLRYGAVQEAALEENWI